MSNMPQEYECSVIFHENRLAKRRANRRIQRVGTPRPKPLGQDAVGLGGHPPIYR